jgi:hypothetical protein
MDANHRFAPTINYFNLLMAKIHEQSVLVLDDIHYSREMEEAWIAIQKHPKVFLTVDIYKCGIVFFDPSFRKQHVVLRF